jgi:hypothetical protein
VRRDGSSVCLRSRPGRDCTEELPELAPIQTALGHHRVLLDGELVCLGADGSPDFASLRRRLRAPADKARRHAERSPVTHLAFDVLHLDGRSTRELPYQRQRELLLELGLNDGIRWRTPRHFIADSERVLAATREHGLEGVVAKRLGSPYLAGARNGAWVKHLWVRGLRRSRYPGHPRDAHHNIIGWLYTVAKHEALAVIKGATRLALLDLARRRSRAPDWRRASAQIRLARAPASVAALGVRRI